MSGKGIIDENALNAFTDGSSYPNQQRASGVGVRFVWVNDEGNEVVDDYISTGWQKATIDEMEIQACIIAVQEAKRLIDINEFTKLLIFSDSRYVVDSFFKAMNVWPNRKWRGANGLPVSNIELWKKLRKEINTFPTRVDIEWVKAHKKNLHNKAADRLAKASAQTPVNKPISISETAPKWSNRKTKRGCVNVFGQETKIRIISRKQVNKSDLTEYRYEIIDPDDSDFQAVDFIYSDLMLSRHGCYHIILNHDQRAPRVVSIIAELESSKYKY